MKSSKKRDKIEKEVPNLGSSKGNTPGKPPEKVQKTVFLDFPGAYFTLSLN